MSTTAPETPAQTAAPAAPEGPARGRRRARRVATVVGVVGLIGCVVLAIGILLGRSWVSDGVGGLLDDANQAIGRGGAIAADASTRTAQRAEDLRTVVTATSSLDLGARVPPVVSDAVTAVATKYDAVRDRYVEIRAQVAAALATLDRVSRLVPGLEVPSGPRDAVTELDQRLTAIDANITSLRESVGAGGTVQKARDAITALGATLDRVAELTTRIETATQDLQQRVDDAHRRIDLYLWLATGGMLLVVVYVAVLNGLVIWLARD